MTAGSRITTVLSVSLPMAGKTSALSRKIIHACVAACDGRDAGGGGEILLAEFGESMAAIECAQHIVQRLGNDTEHAIEVRIGIGQGVVEDDGNAIYGDAVDIASQLCRTGPPGAIVVSGTIREQAQLKSDLAFRQYRPQGHSLPVPAFIVAGEDTVRHSAMFVRELVRRRIFRAAGAYVVLSWLLVQVASIVFPEFDFPDWSMRVLIVLLTVGFPLAMLLAWTLDVTSSGFAVTADSPYSQARGRALQFGIVSTATLISAAVLWWAWADYLQPTTERLVRGQIRVNPVIAVNSLSKLSGSDDLNWLGDGIANLIRNELAESRHVIVMSPSRWAAVSICLASTELLSVRERIRQ